MTTTLCQSLALAGIIALWTAMIGELFGTIVETFLRMAQMPARSWPVLCSSMTPNLKTIECKPGMPGPERPNLNPGSWPTMSRRCGSSAGAISDIARARLDVAENLMDFEKA